MHSLWASCMAAVQLGLTPKLCGLLFACYDECGYVMQHEGLREVCQVLADMAEET